MTHKDGFGVALVGRVASCFGEGDLGLKSRTFAQEQDTGQPSPISSGFFQETRGNAMHAVCTQYKVLYFSNYPNPSCSYLQPLLIGLCFD